MIYIKLYGVFSFLLCFFSSFFSLVLSHEAWDQCNFFVFLGCQSFIFIYFIVFIHCLYIVFVLNCIILKNIDFFLSLYTIITIVVSIKLFWYIIHLVIKCTLPLYCFLLFNCFPVKYDRWAAWGEFSFVDWKCGETAASKEVR